MTKKPTDLTGLKINKLTVIEFAGYSQDKSKKPLWRCQCECGKEAIVRAHMILSGRTQSCGCVRKETSKKLAAKLGPQNRKMHPKISTAKYIWEHHNYKDGISFEIFLELSQQICFYCGRPPFRTYNRFDSDRSDYQLDNGNFTYNGLDRIDSTKGHTKDNVVPCCWNCNRAKNNMKFDEFVQWIKLVYTKLCA